MDEADVRPGAKARAARREKARGRRHANWSREMRDQGWVCLPGAHIASTTHEGGGMTYVVVQPPGRVGDTSG